MIDLTNDIRDYIYQYIKGDISLNDFQAWFIPAIWNIHKHGDLPTQEMVSEILGRLAEYLNRDWSQDEFKDILRRIAQNITVSLESQIITSSDSDNIMFEEQEPQIFQAYSELSEAPSNKNYHQEISQTNRPLRFSFA
jgi:hypothetical protein